MAFFISKKDPIKENVASVLSQCNYGSNYQNVFTQIYNFLTQYPQFELTADYFTYNGSKSQFKFAFLRGSMILTIDYEEKNIPLYFVCVFGFPAIAPKAFLAMENNNDVIRDNPFVLKNMEILNQYMNNWKGFHSSYNLNTMYYYIYQSFLLKPPVSKSEDIRVVSQPDGSNHNAPPPRVGPVPAADSDEDYDDDSRQMKAFRLKSKVDNFLENINRLVTRLTASGVKMAKTHTKITQMNERINTSKALLESEMQYMHSNMERMRAFIENNEDADTINVDEFIAPEDEVSDLVLEYLAEEKACEETMELLKDRFRK